jgi:predicted enzyme related to lactoylglutathione lyase
MGAPVAFFEIAGPDGEALAKFYSAAFDWKIDASRVPGYGYVETGVAGGVRGGIRKDPPDKVLYIQVPELQPAIDRVVKLGGSVVLLPTVVPGVVTFALFKDPAGNLMGLIKG